MNAPLRTHEEMALRRDTIMTAAKKLTVDQRHALIRIRDGGAEAWCKGKHRAGGSVSRMFDRLADAGLCSKAPHNLTAFGHEVLVASPNTKHLVFVYGTLKRGLWNNHCLGKSRFVGEATTADQYRLYSGRIPFLRDANDQDPNDGHHIKGEVFEVESRDLARVDRLESHPYGYKREFRPITIDGKPHHAWVYIYQRDMPDDMLVKPAQPGDDVIEWQADEADVEFHKERL